ncbi:hypothetical protein GPALN_011305 [Globodera pallida]|nr:hypothetical protein GPALN_011305 [Globodera pallida]
MLFSPIVLLLFPILVPSGAFILTPESARQRSSSRPRPSAFRRLGHLDDGAAPVITNRNPIVLSKPSVVHYFCQRQTSKYFALWLNLEVPLCQNSQFAINPPPPPQQFGPFAIDCWADNMRLDFNTTSGKAKDLAGVNVRVPGFGHTRTVEWLDASKRSPSRYFAPIVSSLIAWGYRRGVDIAGAPYDWRKTPEELIRYFAKLRSLIEQLFHANGNRKVIVLAHSMGNPLANFFYNKIVDKAWKDTFLLAHISLAGAWGGSAQVVKLFASALFHQLRLSFPIGQPLAFGRSFGNYPEAILKRRINSQNYSLSNLDKFFADIQYPQGFDQWKSVSRTLVLDPPGVKIYCIFGIGVDTPEQFEWTHSWFFPNYQPYIHYGDGDGTVNRRSLEVCERWGRTTPEDVVVHRLNDTDHLGILSEPRTLALLRDILVANGEGGTSEGE